MAKLVYVAGPYMGSVKENIEKAEKKSIELIQAGYAVITSHKNTAGYEQYENRETKTHQTWLDMDLILLERCDILYVLKGPEKSKGTQIEIAFAQAHNIPVVYEL